MFAQIILGIAMIVKGILHWINSKVVITNRIISNISGDQIGKFQKEAALPHFLLGMLLISMGIIEEINILQTPLFIAIYIILGIIPLGMSLINNKKFSDSYWLR